MFNKPIADGDDPVGLPGDRLVVSYDDDRLAVEEELFHELHHFLDPRTVQSNRGLVEDQCGEIRVTGCNHQHPDVGGVEIDRARIPPESGPGRALHHEGFRGRLGPSQDPWAERQLFFNRHRDRL